MNLINFFFRKQLRNFFTWGYTLFDLKKPRIILIGAGEAGEDVVKKFVQNNLKHQIYTILDDDPKKQGKNICGISVNGTIDRLKKLASEMEINEVIISIEQIPSERLDFIIESIDLKKTKIKILPAINEIVYEKPPAETIRKVSAEDLTGRAPLEIDRPLLTEEFHNKTIFITGAGGSIGSEICHQLLQFPIHKIICLCRSEYSMYKLQEKLGEEIPASGITKPNIEYALGDIRDTGRLLELMHYYKPEIVFHTAAHKHVPYLEEHTKEAWKNNVVGTGNVLSAAEKSGVRKFVLVSTDKAVNPTNIMGATKRIAEFLTTLANKEGELLTSVVRFGNVLGSRGSVVPLFQKQILKGGPITITHPDVVRYFMTIPEAALLVIHCLALSNGKECFVLDMGDPIKIDDLVRKMIRLYGLEPEKDIAILYTGLRPGEKLYEELLTKTEDVSPTSHKKIFCFKDSATIEKEIETKIFRVTAAIDAMTNEELREKLHELVPEFIEPTF